MKSELIINFMPIKTTECVDEFLYDDYEKLILSTDDYYYVDNGNGRKNWTFYKVFIIIEKERINKLYLNDVYPEFYKYTYKLENGQSFKITNSQAITFTDLKNNNLSTLWYIICKTIDENKHLVKGETINLDFKASYPFNAKKKSDIGFDGSWGYLEGGIPKMQHLYINGIRLNKINHAPRRSSLNAPESIIYPEKFNKILE